MYNIDYSLYREREISTPPPYVKSDLIPAVCIAIVTVRRDSDGYFKVSVSLLLEGLDERERSNLYLSVLFANIEPRVERLTDSAASYNVSDNQLKHLHDLEIEKNFYKKGQLNAPYTIIFEDDIIIATGWLSKTLKALADITRLEGYIVVISIVYILAFTILVYIVGKYNLIPLRRVVEINKSGYCTQGLVFPRGRINRLINFLSERGYRQTDSIIKEYADSQELNRYALAPPQLQYIGLKSSRDNLDINTRST
ncbi:Glycosyl transferase family 54 [Penicillium cf. griseofulvum]|nr:Glycosyl transferase family 54 [Penicillium cf. griseofulvum]